ncbi:MAG: hypothetical protein KDI63_04915 [Gammaproteobacteria bacterium]|nr:hypothetical protein [Gammaproteobacteria bacterium]
MNDNSIHFEDESIELDDDSIRDRYDKSMRALNARRKIEQIMELRRLRELDDSIQLGEID